MQRIKKGDLVQIISGNQVGVRGTVEEVIHAWYIDQQTKKRVKLDPNKDLVRVEGVNVRKKHKKRTAPNIPGEIVDITTPVHISNVMVVCKKCDEATRIGYKQDGDKKTRFCKRCNSAIDA
jgi:large subunit ribosomal protein L24